jgi:hypothetical protein
MQFEWPDNAYLNRGYVLGLHPKPSVIAQGDLHKPRKDIEVLGNVSFRKLIGFGHRHPAD